MNRLAAASSVVIFALSACSTPDRTPAPAGPEADPEDAPRDARDVVVVPFDPIAAGPDVVVGTPRVCTPIEVREDEARVLLVVDRSGSMGEPFPPEGAQGQGGLDKWSALRASLTNLTSALTDTVEHGLVLFPDRIGDVCDGGREVVGMGRNNATQIAQQLDLTSPGGGTPTAASLDAVRQAALPLLSAERPLVVVLATDGAPNCNQANTNAACACTDPDAPPGSCAPISCVDDVGTFAQLGELRELGVKTFVLGVAVTPLAAATIEQMAIRGGGARASEPAWFDANDPLALESALADILDHALACRVTTDAPLADDLEVRADDDVIARDPDRLDGWERVGANSIELYGPACDRAIDATISVSSCDA